ncbi:hypothetical protein [Mucilaginibacter psychrotolerans]|uniref:Uncharacterized protein n=1 Tax=Mucilaginibacter psychrotolerans TaxID=1524096 RepID=A0A4Y8RXF2_9SPHI|nr:hypothetical protein [Mucilaginibacter psychrotolerans]TFF30392.1 hypothetical protein E2R66_27430 [Mucilaginibacter psychrotolerans]
MKYLKTFQIIAIVAYFSIFLKGLIVGIFFVFWLVGTVFDFGNIDQLFALLAVSGLVVIFKNRNKSRTLRILLTDILCFFLLAAPIIGRLTAVSLDMFNYNEFIIPTGIFVLSYLVSLVFSCQQYLDFKREEV